LPAVRVVSQSVVGDGHVRCVLAGEGGGRLKAMAFASVPEEVRMLLQTTRGPVHIAGFLRADDWNGRRDVQFMVHDAAPV
jgi:single-stranded-DNA-specific exonuclease